MSVNNLLFSVQNMAPALLNVGYGKTQNYSNLADLNSSLLNGSSNSLLDGLNGSTSDTVTLTYKNIGNKIVSDMAAVTANNIKENPNLDGDYVIAMIDDGSTREVRVYRRSEILENFQGTEDEKASLKKQLDENPLMVFNNSNGLPDTTGDSACQKLAGDLNEFLKANNKTLNTLSNAGYDPFADMLGSSTLKKILANHTQAVESNVDNKKEADDLMEQLKEIIEKTVKEYSDLEDDYVAVIIDNGSSRETRVYRMADILENFEGTEQEKEDLEKELKNNPVLVYSNGNGLPASFDDTASQRLALNINEFLQKNSDKLNELDKAGFDPLADLLGSSGLKKILAECAFFVDEDDE